MLTESYQFRPDVFTAVVDAIALIRNSKRDIVTFFRGAGLEHPQMREYERQIQIDRGALRKTEMAYTLLKIVNEISTDDGLKIRREILKAVVDFNNFEAVFPDKTLAAKGAVVKVRELVNEKDAFTRMQLERESERSKWLAQKGAEQELERRKKLRHDDIKRRLYALFTMEDEYERGRLFEVLLNDWCAHEGILVKESFRITGDKDRRTIEQIDGLIEIGGHLYVVEIKWWKSNLGPKDIAQHVMRVFTRGDARGLFIANPGYTDAAIQDVRRALTQKVIVLGTTEELYNIMARDHSLSQWIGDKANAAIGERNPFKLYYPTSNAE
jgi:hypothetical protein